MIPERLRRVAKHVASVKEIHEQDVKIGTARYHFLMPLKRNIRAQENGAGSGVSSGEIVR